jgi:hypothetical protein
VAHASAVTPGHSLVHQPLTRPAPLTGPRSGVMNKHRGFNLIDLFQS